MLIKYSFCFICSEQCMNIISSRKKSGLFSSAFKKNIPYNTTSTFQEVCGVIQPLIFCRWHKNFSFFCVKHQIMV